MMADSIREALERAARELDLVAGSLINIGWTAAGRRARNEAHAARAALAAQPPAPAPAPTTDTPLDLDALLSPEGAYEPGTGHEEGAQLVDQLEWWAPVHGCDTLENLLDRIRARILPHLRPPIAGIDVPGPDGDYGDVLDLCAAEGVDPRVGVPLLKRAREAWLPWLLATPPAQAAGEVGELVAWLLEEAVQAANSDAPHSAGMLTWAAQVVGELTDLMERQVAPVAVAVSEQPWKREAGWLDLDGECWWWSPDGPPYWTKADPTLVYEGWLLPAHALPLPTTTPAGEEGV